MGGALTFAELCIPFMSLGSGYNPGQRHTKDVIKMISDALLLTCIKCFHI